MNKKIKGSCKNQHIIPQFLQRQFTKTGQLYRHTKEKSFIVNITNNFSQNEYYSERPLEGAKEKTLDQKITEQEALEFSPHLSFLLTLETNKEFLVDEKTSNFIYHFILRNKKIIKSFIEAFDTRFNVTCSTEEAFKNKIFQQMRLNLIPEFKYNNYNADWNKIKNRLYQGYDTAIGKANTYWFDTITKVHREIHEKCLNNNKGLEEFKLKIIEGFYVLPNTVLIGYNSKANIKYLPYIDCETEYILFPISSNKLLIVYKDNFPFLNNDEINQYLVSGSDEFCSELSKKDPLIMNLINYIYTNKINSLLNADIEENTEKVINDKITAYAHNISNDILKIFRNRDGWRKIK